MMLSKLFSHSYAGNVPKYFIYGALYNFMLFFPVWVIFLQETRGLTLPQVTFVDVAFWLTTALAELPTGLVADTIGRKQSMIICVLLTTFSLLMFAFAESFPLLMLANSLWAVAVTFESGAGLALLYDSLKEIGQEDNYVRVRARHQVVLMVSLAVATIFGGVAASWWGLQTTFVISAGLIFLSLFFVLGIKEPPYDPDPDTGERVKFKQAILMTGKAIKKSPNLRMVLLYRNVLPIGVALASITFYQPHARQIGVPIAMVGVFLFIFRLFRIFGASIVGRVDRWIGLRRLLWLAPVVTMAAFLALGLIESWVGLVLFSVAGFTTALVSPMTETVVMRYAPGAVRATVLSVDVLIFRFFQTFVEPGLGVLAEQRGLSVMFIVLGIGTFALAYAVMLRWRRYWKTPVPA
jgi:predicted MFS family arabinose efflux permease